MLHQVESILYGKQSHPAPALNLDIKPETLTWLQNNLSFVNVNGFAGGSGWGCTDNGELSCIYQSDNEIQGGLPKMIEQFSHSDPLPLPLRVVADDGVVCQLADPRWQRVYRIDSLALRAIRALHGEQHLYLCVTHRASLANQTQILVCYLNSEPVEREILAWLVPSLGT